MKSRGRGFTFNDKGYARITKGKWRGRYLHRHVMALAAAEFCYYPLNPKSGLPDGFHVDHVDHRRRHNCLENLLLLDARIHDHLSWASWLDRPERGEIPGQELPTRGPDDWDPEERKWERVVARAAGFDSEVPF